MKINGTQIQWKTHFLIKLATLHVTHLEIKINTEIVPEHLADSWDLGNSTAADV